ncbi:MAG: GAF domain-containing protein [Oscillochloris sp.]|nr:GAF domain-containing protein [Oscillochloris sp.]
MTATQRLADETIHEQLQRNQRELRLIAEISGMIGQAAPLPTILERIAAGVAKLLETPYSAILLLTLDGRQLSIERAYGLAPAYIDMVNRYGIPADDAANLPSLEVCRSGRPMIWNDMATEPSMAHLREAQQLQGVRAMIAVPLKGPNGVIGSLNCYHRQPYLFHSRDIELLSTIGAHAAVAIHNARLIDQMRSTVRRLSEMNAVIQDQHETLTRSEVIHRRLTTLVLEEDGLHAIVSTLASLLGCGVCLYDQHLSALAEALPPAPNAAPAPVLSAQMRTGGLLDVQRRSPGLFYLEPGPGVSAAAVVCPLVARERVLGYVVVPERAAAGELGRRAIEHAAIACALELLKQAVVRETEWRQASGFLDDLLSGRFEGRSEMLRKAGRLGIDVSRGLRLICVRGRDADVGRNTIEALHQLAGLVERALEGLQVSALVVPRADHCLVFLPLSGTAPIADVAEAIQAFITAAQPGLVVSIALSGALERIDDMLRAYGELEETLAVIDHLALDQAVLCYDEIGVFGLILRGTTRNELVRLARQRLANLLNYHERRGVDLIATLECYLAAGCSPQRVAERLFVHPNTVKHRLRLIAELSGVDLSDMRRLLELQLALLVRRLHPAEFVDVRREA